MKSKVLVIISILSGCISCQEKGYEQVQVNIKDHIIKADFPGISLMVGRPGIELLYGPGEQILTWYPEGAGH